MDVNKVKVLLDKYFAGASSLQEEEQLREYFSSNQVDASLKEDRAFFLAASDAMQLPETDEAERKRLQAKLSRQIDGWNMVEKTSVRSVRRVDLRWIAGIAASLTLLFSFGYFLNNHQQQASVAMHDAYHDTYTGPRDAAAEAQKALMKFSVDLNKGLDKVSEATN